MKAEVKDRFHDNIRRVRTLVDVYENKIGRRGQGRRPVGSTDVLRAAVVLLHATLEDLVRTISRERLPAQGDDVLDRVPLFGLEKHGRPERFFLGKIAAFRGRTVDQVISISVEEYLNRTSYNNPEALADAIGCIGLEKAKVEHTFGRLKELMNRRHQIVHTADISSARGQGHHRTQSIGVWNLEAWIEAVQMFGDGLISQLP